jgi:hypothetical protein
VVALIAPIAGFVAALAEVPQVSVRAVGGALAVLVGGVGPVVAYRWAVRRFELFVLD